MMEVLRFPFYIENDLARKLKHVGAVAYKHWSYFSDNPEGTNHKYVPTYVKGGGKKNRAWTTWCSSKGTMQHWINIPKKLKVSLLFRKRWSIKQGKVIIRERKIAIFHPHAIRSKTSHHIDRDQEKSAKTEQWTSLTATTSSPLSRAP